MKRLHSFLALLLVPLVLVVAACGSPTPTTNPGAPLSATLMDEKALFYAEAAMYGANLSASSAVDAGLIQPGSKQAIDIADKLDRAKQLLDIARAAYEVGDSESYHASVEAMTGLISDVWKAVPS